MNKTKKPIIIDAYMPDIIVSNVTGENQAPEPKHHTEWSNYVYDILLCLYEQDINGKTKIIKINNKEIICYTSNYPFTHLVKININNFKCSFNALMDGE